MKKYFNSIKFKNHIRRRQNYVEDERFDFKDHVKIRNIRNNRPKLKKKTDKIKDYLRGFKTVHAPTQFSLVKNVEETIAFFNSLKVLFDNKKKVFVVLKKVSAIDYDAITVLLSIMVKFKTNKIEFNGDFPDSLECRSTLKESGFVKYLERKYMEPKDRYDLNFNHIHTHAWKLVDSKLSARIIEKAALKLWKEPRRCQGAQRIFIELMMNTNNHAAPGMEGEKHWWLSSNYNVTENKVGFCFVDFGVGVFNSLEQKQEGNKFYKWKEKLKFFVNLDNNAEILEMILKGDFHRTVTKKYYRGKGLPGISSALTRNQVSNLFVITNNVWADVKAGNYKLLRNNFKGTFIYFELNEKNVSHGNN